MRRFPQACRITRWPKAIPSYRSTASGPLPSRSPVTNLVQELTTMANLEAAASELRAKLRGDLLTSADPAYDSARKVYNGMIDRRPAMIVRCVDVADVIAAVAFARD